MLVHGAAADREVVGDLLIARALDEIVQDICLARGDAVRLRRVDGMELGTERIKSGRQVRRTERGDDDLRRREGVMCRRAVRCVRPGDREGGEGEGGSARS